MNSTSYNPIVQNGLDNLSALREAIAGKRLGLVTNPSAIDRNGHAAVDALAECGNIVAYYAPEHGIRGDLQNGVTFKDSVDERTGKMVYALYGKTAHLTRERIQGIDAILYDIQDVGSRAFSYLRTLAYLMQDCIELDLELIVLDRINPLGGELVEGVMAEPELDKRWGFGVPMRFGLTTGEYARMVNAHYYGERCRLSIVPCLNWRRDMMFEECGLFWVNPSPNLPSPNSALIYAGGISFEQTNISGARGTTRPFEMYGAPFADGYKLSERLNRLNLPGVFFRPCAFMSEYNAFDKYVRVPCRGVQPFVTNRHAYNSFETAMWMLETFRECCPEFAIPFPNGRCLAQTFDCVMGSADWRLGKLTTPQFIERGRKEAADFKKSVNRFLLY